MAKPQKASNSAKDAGKKEKKEEKPAVKRTALYKVARKLTSDDKMPKQMKVLYDVLEAAGKAGLTREEWAEKLVGQIETKQPITRIIGYYQARMESAGMITIEKKEVPA